MIEERTSVHLVEALRRTQRERWQAGERVSAETYLEQHPQLQADTEGVLELVYSEVVLRQRLGEVPGLEEYRQRFPQFAARLEMLFELHRALEGGFDRAETATHCATPARDAVATTALPEIPGYEIVGELGRGGMGVVYKAQQESLNRLVALKVILAGAHANAEQQRRFRAEAEAIARLRHPNFVQVYDYGVHGGRPFLALEYVEGGTLAQKSSGVPQPPCEAAHVVETLAAAMEHAHRAGLVHRDLKPANVLLTADGVLKVTDFGLAKHLVREPRTLEPGASTQSGALLGTPVYMAPEQVSGGPAAVGPAADVYALGAILYELLTGRPPFQGAGLLELLLQVQDQEPAPPRRLRLSVPRDLETICLKCLEKDPRKRYASAADLAADLRRFQAGEPVRARRIGMWERGVKWVKRRPAVAGLLAVSAAAVVTLIVGTLVHNARLEVALQQARLAEQEKTRQLAIAHLRDAQARRNSGLVGRRFESLEALKKATEHFRALGQLDEKRTLELRNEAIACLALADLKPGKEWNRDPGWSRPYAFDPTLQYYVVRSAADDHPEKPDAHQGHLSVRRVADDQEIARLSGFGVRVVVTQFSPNGRYLAAHYEWGERHNYVWDLSRREAILKVPQGSYDSFPSFSPDSRLVALAQPDHSIRIYELPSGATCKDLLPSLPVRRVQFHPDGRRLAVVSGRIVQLCDLNNGKEVAAFKHPGPVHRLAWRSDGKVFATGCEDHDIYLWEVANPAQPLRILKGHFGAVVAVAFNHGGDLLLSNSWDSTSRLWDPATGQQLLSKPGGVYREHLFRPDDQELDDGWQVATGRECRTFHGTKELRWVAVSPRGRLMASTSAGGVQLWDLAATREGDKELATLPVGLGAQVHFDPKGESLVTARTKVGLQRWPIAPDPETGGLRIGPPQSLGLSARAPWLGLEPEFALSADGRIGAHSPHRGKVVLFNLENPRRKLLIESPELRFATFSPDGRWLATGNWQGQGVKGRGVKVWDAQTGELAKDFDLGETEEGAAWPAFSPTDGSDGKWLVTGTFAEYCFWEVGGSWQKRHALPRANAGKAIGWIVFSPDGKMVALLHSVSEVRLVDPVTGREFARLPTSGGPFCFSPDGSQLVTRAGRDGAIQVWDLRLIRRQLAEMGLDWDLPPHPPPRPDSAKPLHIKVLAAERPAPSKELDAEAHLERGFLYLQLRQYKSAIDDFDRASTLDPKRARWEEVVRAYSQAIEQHPDDAEAYHQRAHAHERLAQWDEAINDLSQAITRAPQRLDLLGCRGKAYLGIGRKDKAAEDFRKASEGKPDQANRLARGLVTTSNLLQREPGLAVELAERAVRQGPGEALYWNTLGIARYRLGEWEAAIQSLLEAEKLAPGQHVSFNAFFLALCHYQLGDPVKARDHYDRAVRWCQENEGKLSAQQQQELKAFRLEAEAMLRAPPPGP